MFAPLEPLLTGRSFLSSIKAALEIDDAGLDSKPNSPILSATTLPSSPLTPVDSDASSHSMDVPRTSITISQSSPVDDRVVLPAAPSEHDWSDGSSGWLSDAESDCGSAPTDGEFNGSEVAVSLPAPANKKKRRRVVDDRSRAAHKKRRSVTRTAEAEILGPTAKRPLTFRGEPSPLAAQLPALSTMPVTSTGFTSQRLKSLQEKHVWRLSELKSLGMAVFPWDGQCVLPFCYLPPADIQISTGHLLPSLMMRTVLLRCSSVSPSANLARLMTGRKSSPGLRPQLTTWRGP